jgi:fructokinase
MMRIGIDLGGTKIEGVLMAPDGSIAAKRREPTPRGDYDATIATIVSVVRELEARGGERCTVGVGIPGTISPASGVMKNANSTWLNGHALDRDLERALGRDVRLANDANCFALSEAADGAGAGAPVVFGVILGTGVGGGIVFGGRAHEGPNGVAGEWGHNPLPWPDESERPGPPCYCARRGCIETFLSGPGLVRDALEHGATGLASAEELAERAANGDRAALRALERYEHRLSRALATIINVLDPDVVVLGGGLSNIGRLYTNVPRLWNSWVFSDRVDTRLVRAAHGDSSGVRGAARLF